MFLSTSNYRANMARLKASDYGFEDDFVAEGEVEETTVLKETEDNYIGNNKG